jgi:cobalamin biosynthetic protein CobC
MAMVSDPGAVSLVHGGDLALLRKKFPSAPQPFVDLSTGINPHPYPLPQLSAEVFSRLPQAEALAELLAIAAAAYGAPSPDHVVAGPGTQILLPAAMGLLSPGGAMVLGPTYAEYIRVATLLRHSATQVSNVADLEHASLAVLANPNNPDGRILPKITLIDLADKLRARGGLLMVDEAFADVVSADVSLAAEVERGKIVVLRSFGKFFGLAGLRLGFALAAPDIVRRLAAWLGPWAVPGPAVAVGQAALADTAWIVPMRARLRREADRLEQMLEQSGLQPVGGTSLFRLVRTPAAGELFRHLGCAGIFVRRFAEDPHWLRFGLPGTDEAWSRLGAALAKFQG